MRHDNDSLQPFSTLSDLPKSDAATAAGQKSYEDSASPGFAARPYAYGQPYPQAGNAGYASEPVPSSDPKVLHDVNAIERSAQNFLDTGNRGFAEEFQQELKQIAEKGPAYTSQVLQRAAADSHKDMGGGIFLGPTFIEFSPPPYQMEYQGNLRYIRGAVKDGQAVVTAEPDKYNVAGDHSHEIIIK